MQGRDIASIALEATVKIVVHRIDGSSATGTGFFIEPGNRLVTCRHVIDSARPSGILMTYNGKECVLGIQIEDKEHDFSILDSGKISAKTKLQLGSNNVHVGDEVYFAGFPSGVNKCSLFKGIISAKGENLISNYPFETIQINGVLNKGNSGGPLVNLEGKVIGICSSKYVPLFRDIEKFQNFVKEMPLIQTDQLQMQGVDFGEFYSLVKNGFEKLSTVLILISTGIGYAIPVEYLSSKIERTN